MKTKGNKILITGANSGIGLALTRKFLELGNQVVGVSRRTENLSALKNDFLNLKVYACDLTDDVEFEQLLSTLKTHHGDLTVLINNAGIQYNDDWLKEPDLTDRIANEIKLNLTVPLQLTAAMLPDLIKQDEAAVVNVTSAMGFVPKYTAPTYCGSKAGLHIATQALRGQFDANGAKKIHFFELVPPLVSTAMTKDRPGAKMSPEKLVNAFLKGFENNHYEMKIGKVRLLGFIHRFFPELAREMINR